MSIAQFRALAQRSRTLCLVILASTVFASLLPAQSTWAQIPRTVSANLWGTCYGGGQFVAVGERGTILTSPDGLAWTPRTSGTTAWLTSVAYGFNHYLAVGADRTILSSLDGSTWETIASFPANTPRERLNVVGFDHDRFLAYGEHDFALTLELPARIDWRSPYPSTGLNTWWRSFALGLGRYVVVGETGLIALDSNESPLGQRQPIVVPPSTRSLSGIVFDHGTFTAVGEGGVILSSSDALTWSLQSSGTILGLNALAPFNNTLITVGAGGVILVQSRPLTWTPRLSPTSELLLALAASDTAAIAVGGSGTIIRTTAAPQLPTLATSPVSVTETLTGAASFVVRARGSLPLRYQWSRNGVALPGETRADLIRAPLTPADAGSYTVVITNSAGTVTSAPATLALLPAPRPVVDATFRADPTFDQTPAGLLALPDGSLLVADGKRRQLLKLTATGSLDPTWQPSTFGPPAIYAYEPNFSVLVAQPDGRILVGGQFIAHNGQARSNLIRLNPDGSWDASFVAAPEIAASTSYIGLKSLAVQRDGRILVAHDGTTPLRLVSNGSLDPSFHPQPLPLERDFVNPVPSRSWTARAVDLASDGKIYVGFEISLTVTRAYPRANGTVVRLLPDGTIDPTFSAPRSTGGFVALRVLPDDSLLYIGRETETTTIFANVRVARFQSNGLPFPNYAAPLIPQTYFWFIYPDGRVLYFNFQQGSPVRLTSLGRVDSTFTGGLGQPTVFAATTDDRVFVAGDFTTYDGVTSNRLARLNSVPDDSVNAPRILSLTADKTTVTAGDTITFRAAVTGSGPLVYEWTGMPGNNQPNLLLRTNSSTLTLPITTTSPPNFVQLTVRNHRGAATSARLDFTLTPTAPTIVQQPNRVSVQSGREFSLALTVNPNSGRNEVLWRRNGQPLGPDSTLNYTSLYFPKVTAADAGTYTLTLTNALGVSITSAPIVLTVDDTSRFTNLSTRALIGAGDQSAIAGFVISGIASRTVLIRGIGPGLAQFGVVAPLADPQLTLFDQNGQTNPYRRNADWSANDDSGAYLLSRFQSLGAFPLDRGSKDAALLLTLDPGTYTVQLSAPPGQTGTALLELYEADNDAARILNLSTRALVTPAAPAFAGFAIRGPVAKTVLVRAAGPTLAAFGLTNPLARPRLTVRDSTGTAVATNSSSETAPDRPALLRATQSVGAFPFAAGSNDSALLLTLPPGNYTAVIESPDATSGLVLAEIYELPVP